MVELMLHQPSLTLGPLIMRGYTLDPPTAVTSEEVCTLSCVIVAVLVQILVLGATSSFIVWKMYDKVT